MISLIVAVSANNVIGIRGQLPWRLPADLRRFKAITMGKPIVMGRLTWDSIGHALPGRQNIVVSRQPDFEADDCTVVRSPQEAIEAAGQVGEIMVIGGGQLYAEFLPVAERIYLTQVHSEVEGDAFFPELDRAEWAIVASESHRPNDQDAPAFTFMTLERRSS